MDIERRESNNDIDLLFSILLYRNDMIQHIKTDKSIDGNKGSETTSYHITS